MLGFQSIPFAACVKAFVPNANACALSGDNGSPQLTTNVNVSSVPGSTTVPDRVVLSFSLMGETTETSANWGATFATVTWNVSVWKTPAPFSSSSVTVTVYNPLSAYA